MPINVEISLRKGNVALGFSAISVYSMIIPYHDKACAACGMCVQPSSHAESEITIASFPSPHPAFHCLQYILPLTESWAEAWKQVLNVSQNPSCLWL